MRKILFRGRCADSGEWVESDCVMQDKKCDILSSPVELWNWEKKRWFAVFPETVGQFTAVLDNNGVGMFEGDIVTAILYHSMPVYSVVTFRDGAFGLEWKRGGVKVFNPFTSLCNVVYEVVGNIYDNPELLVDENA